MGTVWKAFKVTMRGSCLAKSFGILCDIRRNLQKLEGKLRKLEGEMGNAANGSLQVEFRDKLSEYKSTAEREVCF